MTYKQFLNGDLQIPKGVLKSTADKMLKINTLNAMTADLAAGFLVFWGNG